MNQIKAVLFSLDSLTKPKSERDTLGDMHGALTAAQFPILSRALSLYDLDKLLRTLVSVFNAVVEQTTEHNNTTPSLQALSERSLKAFMKREPSFDEVLELMHGAGASLNIKIPKMNISYLRALNHSGRILGVVANLPVPSDVLHDVFIKAKVIQYFETLITSNDSGALKPSTELYTTAIASMKCDPHDVMIVGSSLERDLNHLNGLVGKKVFFTTRRRLTNIPPDVSVISSLSELGKFLK